MMAMSGQHRHTGDTGAGRLLGWLMLVYAATSLLHFTHNAEYLADYPNLPAWLSPAGVYLAWCAVTLLGVMGYLIYRGAQRGLGLLVVGVYALIGFDGLLHYRRAPFSVHTGMMNFTIWAEAFAAALLLAAVLWVALRRRDVAVLH
jgi:hypothetical protein